MTPFLKMATVRGKAMCVRWFFETKSFLKIQRRYRARYGQDQPSDNAIRRWLQQFQETGSVLHRKGAGRPTTLGGEIEYNLDILRDTKGEHIVFVWHSAVLVL
jgi:transposase